MGQKVEVVEIGTELQHTPLEYVYVTIPAEYVCVYHRILAMLADYGIDMLKDCKATCKERNSGVIECFNMFNAAVAARKLNINNGKLAETLIAYIKAKINQIYKGKDNSTSFVFPVDETGQLKAFVSCGERPKFYISAKDGNLYEHKFDNGFDEHFMLGVEDVSLGNDAEDNTNVSDSDKLTVILIPNYERTTSEVRPCADVHVLYDGTRINVNNAVCQYYFDGQPVVRFNDVTNLQVGIHTFKCVVNYMGITAIAECNLRYAK